MLMVKDGILHESLTFLDHCETYGKDLRAREDAIAIEPANSNPNGEIDNYIRNICVNSYRSCTNFEVKKSLNSS